jgi:hypothetical protein
MVINQYVTVVVYTGHNEHTYIPRVTQCPLAGIGTPHPFSRKRVCTVPPPPPNQRRGETHLPADEGVGESQSKTGEIA